MTTEELKKLLDEHRKKSEYVSIQKYEIYSHGFKDAVELLWPLIEALGKYEACQDFDEEYSARKRLKDLEQKLKGE